MREISKQSEEPNLPGILDATSSQESVDGTMPCASQDGPMNEKSGPEVVPASHSLAPGKEKGKPTKGTCGPTSSGSSESAALQRSLESKLQARLDMDGSMEYSLTWKEKATPAGRRYFQLAASVRRIKETDFFGYPTCQSHDALLVSHPTPNVPNGGRRPKGGMSLTGMTPDGKKRQVGLEQVEMAILLAHPTPAARDWRDGRSNQHGKNARPLNEVECLIVHGTGILSRAMQTAKREGLRLNPKFSLWLMGFPAGWECYAEPGTRLSRRSLRSS